MARFYSNENFPFRVVAELRDLGHDVLTIQETGKANQKYPDDAVLASANAANRIVLTINRKHFIRLHNISSNHQGIIVCTYDPDFVGQASRIDKAITAHESLVGRLIRVNRPG
jgi:predicted nuclease of predicted toxin-antitoxin system